MNQSQASAQRQIEQIGIISVRGGWKCENELTASTPVVITTDYPTLPELCTRTPQRLNACRSPNFPLLAMSCAEEMLHGIGRLGPFSSAEATEGYVCRPEMLSGGA